MPDPTAPTSSPPPPRAPLVLLADAHEWSGRSLASILSPFGYEILRVHTGPEVLSAARAGQGDAIMLTETLPEANALDLVRRLRADGAVPQETPIIVIATGPVSRPRLVAALRAGASDMWGLPMDTEELVLRLNALLRAQAAAGRAREEGLVDPVTGLYNHRGMAMRARDLASQADRRHAPLACVVLAPALSAGDTRRDQPAAVAQLDAAVETMAYGLKQVSRSSDAVGRLGPAEFAVLAPDTDARGAKQLGTRLGNVIERTGPATGLAGPLRLRVGYHAVGDFHTAGLGGLDLLARATSALRAAEAAGTTGDGGGAWIRSFESGPGGGFQEEEAGGARSNSSASGISGGSGTGRRPSSEARM
jgi:PleD family two-component response regulator